MEDKKTKEEKPEILPAEVRANMLSGEKSLFFNVALFEQAQRIATMFAESTMVPDHFRNNVGNCMIALNYAARLQADPFMMMQCMYIVYGKPGIEGKLVEAIINASSKYSEPLQYEWLDPEDKVVERRTVLKHKDFDEYGCQAFSIDAKSGKRIDGPKITWKLVKVEGWYDRKDKKTGALISKWRTMPEMMFYYRAASWFGNKNCPELKLGMHTVEELEDIVELTPGRNGAYALKDAAAALNDKLKADKDKPTEDIYKPTKEKPESDKEEKEEEKEDQIRKLYQYPNTKEGDKKFQEFVDSHADAIPNMEQVYQDDIRGSWGKRAKKKDGLLEGDPYPLDAPKEEIPDKEPDDQMKETEKPEPPITLNCPLSHEEQKKNDGGRVNVDVCDNVCEGKDKCVPYMKYQDNIKG